MSESLEGGEFVVFLCGFICKLQNVWIGKRRGTYLKTRFEDGRGGALPEPIGDGLVFGFTIVIILFM